MSTVSSAHTLATPREIPVDRITSGANDRTRFDAEQLQTLADSITELGLLQPITVRHRGSGRYEIVCGERRWRAAKLAGLEVVPCMVRQLDAAATSRAMLTENTSRADLDPIDEAHAYRTRMDEFGLTPGQVAEWAGVTVARVTTRLPLVDLCPEAAHLVSTGALSINHARILAPLDSDRQIVALRQLHARDLTYFAFRDLCVELLAVQQQSELFTDLELIAEEFAAEAVAKRTRATRAQLIDMIARLAEHAPEALADQAAKLIANG